MELCLQTATPSSSYLPDNKNDLRLASKIVLLVLLVHALVLAALYLKPADTPYFLKRTIEVSLDVSPASTAVPEKHTSLPKLPPPPPEQAPAETAAPQVTATPPPTVPAAAAPVQNNAAPSDSIQPLSSLTRMPSFSRKIEAVYPTSERRAGIQANVLTEVTIDAQGNVLDVRILKSGGTTFDEAVKQALQKSSFNPGLIEGKPVGTRFQIPFRFNLN